NFQAMHIAKRRARYFVVQERELGYRFYLHQHPYVQQLIQRLLRKGTSGLQSADTEYSTRITLTNATPGKDSLGEPTLLPAGELMYLTDGATATLDGSAIRFAGGKVLKLLDDSPLTPGANATVTIPGLTAVRQSSGSVVTTEANAAAILVDGVPRPVLFSD